METTTKTTVISRMIQEEQTDLVLTLTPEEVETLLVIGKTSHNSRVKFLAQRYDSSHEQAHQCSNLLAEMYFAAADFKRNQKLAGT